MTRKNEHIELAREGQMRETSRDSRGCYEPLLGTHPASLTPISFLGKSLRSPLWISSMTGGARLAREMNTRLARAAHHFGMGMGLGSCRPLLHSSESLDDFLIRSIIGPDLPLMANLGVAQIQSLMDEGALDRVHEMRKRVEADGLIIHVNPLQEALQREGDAFRVRPIDTIARFLDSASYPVMVKEVGQGMGPESLEALIRLPLAAIEFGAFGGTNFSSIEALRQGTPVPALAHVGHTAQEMTDWVNDIVTRLGEEARCRTFIAAGGVRSSVDGFHLTSQLGPSSLYGQAWPLLERALVSEDQLFAYIESEMKSFLLASRYVKGYRS